MTAAGPRFGARSTRASGYRPAVTAIVSRIRREPGSTLEELEAASKLSRRSLRAVLHILELAGVVEMQPQRSRAGTWSVCVRWRDVS